MKAKTEHCPECLKKMNHGLCYDHGWFHSDKRVVQETEWTPIGSDKRYLTANGSV